MFCLCLKSSFILRNVTGWGVNGEAEQLVLDLMGIHGGPCSISSGHVWMWELGYKEGWVLKNWCFWTVVLEKTLASPLDCKEIQPVHPKGDQSWVFSGRSDVEADTPILWPPGVRADSLENILILGGIGGRRRRGWQRMRWLDGITDSMDVSVNSRSWWWTGRPGVLRFMGSQRVGHDWATDLIWSVLSQGRESTRKWHKIICGWQNYFISWLLWWLNEWTYL